jgi:hypothetical protein
MPKALSILSYDCIVELTQHIPPKQEHLIRYYGLYSSRTKGKAVKDDSLAKYGYASTPQETPGQTPILKWRMYQTKPQGGAGHGLFRRCMRSILCYARNAVMSLKVIAVITEPGKYRYLLEVRKIFEFLKCNHAPPFDKIVIKVS